MVDYLIHGDWLEYTVTVNGDKINRAIDMTALMRWFAYHLEHGDTITWEMK